MTRRRQDKRIWWMGLALFVAVFCFSFLMQKSGEVNEEVQAASLANFDPGYIISDYQMGNYNSMTEAEIQQFLTAKNPCKNRDYEYYKSLSAKWAGTTTAWHWSDGHFVCISEEKFGDGEVIGSGETAAHIIWQAAQDYKINPQVLIVLLEKEQGLITDPIPNSSDYRKAAGYGCPDTAACSSKYYGFKNQIRNAASLFRTVLNGGWTNYPLGNNYIQYNPSASCGGSIVNVRNLATSALYRYTPYQPNVGALAAGYGTATCGAYGNRNFYLYFQDWFGGITNEKINSSFIVEDEYLIESALDNAAVLDVAGGSNKNGANVYLYNNNKAAAAAWKIKNNGDGTYTIINSKTKTVLDVYGAEKTSKTNVQAYVENGTCAQRWKIVKNDDGTVSFFSVCSDLALDAASGKSADGTNVQIYESNETPAQKWILVPTQKIEDGQYSIRSKILDTMTLDIAGGVSTATDGTNIQLYSFNDTDAQRWSIEYQKESGFYVIKNEITGKVLDVEKAGTVSGTNVWLHGFNNTCAQKWQIIRNEDGSYSFLSACSNKALDVTSGKSTNGTNIQIYDSNKTVAQKWTLNKAETISYGGKYKITTALKEDMVLDVAGGVGTAKDGTNIQIYKSNDTPAQQWEIVKVSSDLYLIKNPGSNRVLDAQKAGTVSGTNVWLYTYNNTCAQKWHITENEDGTYTFASACSDLVMDVQKGGTTNSTNVWLYTANGTDAQKWQLEKI